MAGIVAIKIGDAGSMFYLSPGCTVTRTVTRQVDVNNTAYAPSNTSGHNQMQNLGITTSDIIRVDGTLTLTSFSGSNDGHTDASSYEIEAIPAALYTSQNESHYLYWGDDGDLEAIKYHGLIRNVTITQRGGAGEMYDIALTFEIGDVIV